MPPTSPPWRSLPGSTVAVFEAAPLAGRCALVTGADAGIGAAIAGALETAGARVLRHALGGDGFLPADFLKTGEAERLAAESLAAGPVDIFVANAAIERRRPWTDVSEASVTEHVAANFTSLLLLCRALVPAMTERGWGRVVALGSALASRPRAETMVYAALKAAQTTALRAIAREVAARGVTVNIVAPGAIETERTAARYADPAFRSAVTAKIPTGRPGTPADCAGPVVALCTDAFAYVTGAEIPVDGGWTIGDAPGALPGEGR